MLHFVYDNHVTYEVEDVASNVSENVIIDGSLELTAKVELARKKTAPANANDSERKLYLLNI